jgi:chromosome segregation ATPase
MVRATENADGDDIESTYFTGGNHQYNNQGSGSSATARSLSLRFFVDGREVMSEKGYANKIEIRWTNNVQGYNTRKADGTGREILQERHRLIFNGIEWTETTNKLIELQAAWKKVGPVARKYSDDLWKKFTAACDTFFEAKREATKEIREQYAQKRAEAKERWNKKVEQMTDRQKLIRMYENLVQEIKTAENNILFFTGKSKSANKLVDDMRKKIDTLKGQLADLENKINQMDAE